MASNKRVVWELGFVPDKNGLDQVKKLLTEITNAAKEPGAQMNKELQSAAIAASQLKGILHKAWNSELGQLNLNKMKDAINSTYGSVGQLKTALTQCGDVGTRAFNGFASQVLNTNLQIKKSSKLLNDMATTFSNTIRYGISSSVFNRMANEISRAYDFSVQLDKSLNDIRIVTDKSANDMAKFAVQANRAAKAMGASTRDYTEASLIYFQQGLSDEEVKARTDVTIKAANVTAQATADVSEQLTAVWNGYKVSADEAELYIDKLAKVAAETAADLNELSVGMSKVASAANNAGVDIDQMNAMLATVVSVTREAPETIGTSFRTLFARMGDLKLGATDEDGIGLGKVSSQLDAIGVKVLDQQGNMRNMGDVIEDLAAKWQTLTQAQQQAAAVAIGGKMQYSRLIALMDNWDMYTKTLETSRNAAGELQKEQDIYMQSTEAHLQKLKTEAERTYNTLFDMDAVNGFADSLTGLLGIFNNFLEGLGGGTNAILFFGSTLTRVFSEQIGRGIERQIENVEAFIANLDAMKVKEELTTTILEDYARQGVKLDSDSVRVQTEADIAQRILKIKSALTEEEYKQLTTIQKQIGLDKERLAQLEKYREDIKQNFKNENLSLNTLQKRNAITKNEIKQLQQKRTIGEELLSILYDTEHSTEDRFEDLSKILDSGSAEELGLTAQQVNTIIDTVVSGTTEVDRTADLVTQKIKQIDNDLEQQVDLEEKINQAIEVRQADLSGETQQIKDRVAVQDQYLAQLEEQKTRQQAIQEIVKLGSVLTSSFVSVVGIFKTLNDETLTTEQQLSRILPVIISLMTTVGPALVKLPVSLAKIKAGIIPIIASLEGVTVAELKATIAAKGLKAAIWSAFIETPIGPIILAIAAALAVLVVATRKHKTALEEAQEATKNARESAEKAKTAYDNLQKSFDDYDKGVSALEELDASTKEYQTTLEKTNEIILQMISNSAELAKYVTRNPKTGLLEFNPEGKEKVLEESRNRSNRLQSAKSFAEYEESVQKQGKNYTDFIRNELEGGYFTSSKEYYALAKTGEYTNAIIYQEWIDKIIDMLQNGTGEIIKEDLEKNLPIANKEIYRNYMDTYHPNSISNSIDDPSAIETFFLNNSEKFYKYVEQLKDFEKQQNLLFIEGIQSYLKTDSNFNKTSDSERYTIASLLGQQNVEEARQKIKAEWEQDAAFGWGNEDKVHEEYARLMGYDETKTKDHFGDTAEYWDSEKEEFVSIEDDVARAEIVNAKIAEALTENVYDLKDNIEKITSLTDENTLDLVMGALRGDLDYKNLGFSDYTALNELIKSDAFKEGLNEIDWTVLEEAGYKSGEEFIKAVENGLGDEEEREEKFRKNSRDILIKTQSNVGNLTDSYLSGSVTEENISENEDYKKLKEQFSELTALNQDLTAAVDILNDTTLVGTEQWTQALYQVQDEINKLALDKKEEEFADAYEKLQKDLGGKITIQALLDAGDLETQLNDLMNADYAISIEVHSQAEQAFTQISTAMDNIKKQAALIGEDFVVSADNARALGNTFPGIYEQAKISANGQIQLNKDVAQSAIQKAQEEVNANAQATIKKLQSARDELKAKQDTYQGMAKAAWALATGEMEADKTEADYQAQIEDGLELLRAEAEDSEKTSNQRVADNAKENAQITAENWGRSYQNAAEFAVKFANKAIEAAENVANGKQTSGVNSSDFNVNYQGKNGVSGEAQEIQNYQSLLNQALSGSDAQANYAKLAQSFENAATALGEQVNDIDSMIVAAGAKTLETVKGLGNTGSAKNSPSGGKGSSKNPAEEKENKDEIDRYQKVNSQLQIISNTLSDIEKKKSKAFGADYIKELNKELEALNQQLQLTDEKLNIQKDEQRELQQKLGAQGLIFAKSAEGEEDEQYILNYQEIWNAKHDNLNNTIALYNKMSEEEQQAFKKTLEAVQDDWQNFTKDVQHYDTLLNDLHSSMSTKEDIRRKEIAENIEKFNLEIEIRLDMMDAAKDWDSFRRDVLDDWNELWEKESFSEGFFDKKEWNSNLIRTVKEDFDLLNAYFDKEFMSAADGSKIYGSGLVKAQTEHLGELIDEAQKAFDKNTNGLFEDETKTAMDNLKNYKEQAMNTARDIKQKIEDIKAAYLGMLKEASEKFDEQADMLERVSKYLEHDMKLVKLIYGENQYESLDRYYEKQHENNIQQLDFAKGQVDFWKRQMDLATENSDEWKYAKEQWLSAIDSANEKLEAAVETAKEKWENAIDDVFDKMDRKFTGGLGLDYVKEQWSLINKNSDEYLDSINSAYGIQKLQNKYLDAIDKTDSIGNQRKLNDLMNSEIESLQQIDRLTQTDLDRAELKYQIALKEMELEEAQSNKTSMRLRRDSQGNYSYQFVANNEDIDKAKEELEDLKNQLYNFDLKAYRENLDKAATAYEEYMSKMAEAAKIVDPTERAAKEKLIQEEYLEYIGMLQEENERYRLNLIESAIDEQIQLNQLEKEDFINATDEKINKVMNDLVPQWDSGVQQMMDKWSGPGGFKDTTEEAIDALMAKDEEYRQDLDEIQRVADVDFDLIRDTIDDTRLNVLDPYIETNKDLLHTYEEQVDYIRDNLIPQIQDLQEEYRQLIEKIKKANALQGEENAKAANAAKDEREKVYNEKNPEEAKPTVTPEAEAPVDNQNNVSKASSEEGDGRLDIGDSVTYTGGPYYETSYGEGKHGTRGPGKLVKVTGIASGRPYPIHVKSSDSAYGWLREDQLTGYDTGGYTGEWGTNGRLAMLHQKELVLNAEDTSNFLNALDIMRNIVGNIGSDAFARLAAIGGNRSLGEPGAGIEQNVVINADFPNATDHNEIQQAFDNLMNIATQRVNRNRI